jgi:hypothetical protein
MKGICILLLTLAAALLAEADTAVMLEVTPEGAFYRLPSTAPTAPAAGSPGTDSGLLWHFSQVQGSPRRRAQWATTVSSCLPEAGTEGA